MRRLTMPVDLGRATLKECGAFLAAIVCTVCVQEGGPEAACFFPDGPGVFDHVSG